MEKELTRATTKVVLVPIYHYGASTIPTRRTWQATLAERGDESQTELVQCAHHHGHRTIETAKACGIALWKRLP